MGTIIFNGISSKDLNIVIQTSPEYTYPQKDYETIHIQGRTGDLQIDLKSYQNVERSYYIAQIFRPNTNFVHNVEKIVSWLHSASGYARLEDSYDPDVFRLASYKESGSLANLLDEATSAQIRFDCKPQRYLKIGEIASTVTGSISEGTMTALWVNLPNPTDQIAKPLIQMTSNYNFQIQVINSEEQPAASATPEQRVIVAGAVDDVTLDADLEDCYKGTTSYNNIITVEGGFLELKPGNNWVRIIPYATPTVQSPTATISIKPRWWKL